MHVKQIDKGPRLIIRASAANSQNHKFIIAFCRFSFASYLKLMTLAERAVAQSYVTTQATLHTQNHIINLLSSSLPSRLRY